MSPPKSATVLRQETEELTRPLVEESEEVEEIEIAHPRIRKTFGPCEFVKTFATRN